MATETQLPEKFSTRERYRADILAVFEGLVHDATMRDPIAEDLLGVPVVTRKDLDEAIRAVFTGPMPELDEHAAEVATPGYVEVRAECPSCGISARIPVSLTPQLVVDPTGRVLKVKATSKDRVHACGQLTIDEPTNGQTSLALGETAELEAPDAPPAETTGPTEFDDEPGGEPAVADACPFPGCTKKAEHDGEHDLDVVTEIDACGEKFGPRRRLICGRPTGHAGVHLEVDPDPADNLPF